MAEAAEQLLAGNRLAAYVLEGGEAARADRHINQRE